MADAADAVIGRLANGGPIEVGDADAISARMSSAPFNRERYPATRWEDMGERVIGEAHPSFPGITIKPEMELTSLDVHVIKRIQDGAWKPGTTASQYLADLRAVAAAPTAGVHVGVESNRPMAATTTLQRSDGRPATEVVFNPSQRMILVVYDAKRSHLVTGYPVDETAKLKRFRRWTIYRQVR